MFDQKLVENENITGQVLKHMIHTEDFLLLGEKASDYAYDILASVYETLKGNTPRIKVTTKIDGSPSCLAASDFHGRKFVGLKHAFRGDGTLNLDKIAFSEDEISKVSTTEEVQKKLTSLFKALSYIFIPKNEIWSGDYLFSNEDLQNIVLENTPCITFHPNTIVYAIPESDPLASKIKRSNFGIAWHTKYYGEDFNNLRISFEVDKNNLQEVPGIFQIDATIPSIAGKVTMTETETLQMGEALTSLRKDLDNLLSKDFYYKAIEDKDYKGSLDIYRNVIIRTGSQGVKAKGFFDWITERLDKEIEKKKTEKGKIAWENKKQEVLSLLTEDELDQIFDVQKEIIDIKEFFIHKLDNLSTIKTYLKYTNGNYIPANAEGYAISDVDGNVQKMVSRLEFSKANFSQDIAKGWTSEKRIKESALKKFKEELYDPLNPNFMVEEKDYSQVNSLVDELCLMFGVGFKKGEEYSSKIKRVTYTLKPVDGKTRESKAASISDYLNSKGIINKFFHGGSSGTTPIISFNYEGFNVDLKFKPALKGAGIISKDEEYWAFVLAALSNGREDLIPKTEEEMASFNYDDIKGGREGQAQNYITSSLKILNEILNPNKKYLLFRGDVTVNLCNERKYISLHTLINEAAKIVKGGSFSKDMWNPSDIVACDYNCYDAFKIEWSDEMERQLSLTPNERSFEGFNLILKKYLLNKEVVGFSLKMLDKDVHLEYDNIEDNSQEEETSDREFKILGVEYPPCTLKSNIEDGGRCTRAGVKIEAEDLEGNIYEMRYRISVGKSMSLECQIKGQKAKLGKTPKFIINNLYKAYGVESEGELSNSMCETIMMAPEALSNKINFIKENEDVIYAFSKGTPLSIEALKKLNSYTDLSIEDANMRGMWPRIIDFLYLLITAELNGSLDYVMNSFDKGARKEFEGCAPFVKVW